MKEFLSYNLNKLEINKKLTRLNNKENYLLSVENLHTYFPIYSGVFRKITGWVKAVEGINFNLKKGEILGIVGETGCGKSTVARSIIKLYKSNNGEVNFFSNDLLIDKKNQDYKIDLQKLSKKELIPFRSNIQIIFQDPYSSLNPRFTVSDIIREPLLVHKKDKKNEHNDIIMSILNKVGLTEEQAYRFPHEFSGGQRQRIGIARALATNPKLIIADEPVSALDVSIQAQIINLMKDLQNEFQMSYIFIAHDLAVVKQISHNIIIMYLGKIMESGPSHIIYNNPQHPYTNVLLSSIPDIKYDRIKKRIILKGEVPSSINKPSGCVFHTRCPIAQKICKEKDPEYVNKNNVSIKCYFPGKM